MLEYVDVLYAGEHADVMFGLCDVTHLLGLSSHNNHDRDLLSGNDSHLTLS